jgi:hypothetical protein
MRQKRFLIYLACQLLVIVGVTLIFKLAEDRQIAATEAGTLFVLLPLLLGFKERKVAGFRRKSFYVGLAQFWLLFALPIFLLRILNWNVPFAELSVLGIPGETMHRYSSSSYMIMMGFTIWNYFRKEESVSLTAKG